MDKIRTCLSCKRKTHSIHKIDGHFYCDDHAFRCYGCGKLHFRHSAIIIRENLYNIAVHRLYGGCCATFCRDCGAAVLRGFTIEVPGAVVCGRCYRACTICSRKTYKSNGKDGVDGFICKECLKDKLQCHLCKFRADKKEFARCECGHHYCSVCIDKHSHNCDDTRGCTNSTIMSYDIMNYTYKPIPVFYPKWQQGNLYMGIEAEIDHIENLDSTIDNLFRHNDKGRLFYLKRDMSLSHSGIEVISQPCTFDYHVQNFNWETVFDLCAEYGGTGDCDSCGLHVHINKSYMKDMIVDSWKLLKIFELHWSWLLKFSRRGNGSLLYCECYKNDPDSPVSEYQKAREWGRRFALNILPPSTVEFRLWRGTTNARQLFAMLDVTQALVRYAVESPVTKVLEQPTKDFIPEVMVRLNNRSEVVQYLTDVGLIKNGKHVVPEPIEILEVYKRATALTPREIRHIASSYGCWEDYARDWQARYGISRLSEERRRMLRQEFQQAISVHNNSQSSEYNITPSRRATVRFDENAWIRQARYYTTTTST